MNSAPGHDEVEISIFGPGYGECILIHVGNNDWILVDSCETPISKEPASLEYLHRIGVDPDTSVKFIIATHWHDDHVRGLSKAVSECKKATFVCSGALRKSEFLTLVKASGSRPMMESSGVQEFYDIISILEERRQLSKNHVDLLNFAVSNKCLWRKQPMGSGLTCEIHSLSPSDDSLYLAQLEIANLIPKARTPKSRVVARAPNHVAVVLWIRIGNICILLGSDLEQASSPRNGWSVIVKSESRPTGLASVFKIPHHGSANADHPKVWSDMLIEQPIALLTPFNQGNLLLPKVGDIKRICKRTENAFITATPTHKRQKRPKAVEEFIQGATRSIHTVNSSFGHVRLRRLNLADAQSNWNIELFGEAVQLKKLLAA